MFDVTHVNYQIERIMESTNKNQIKSLCRGLYEMGIDNGRYNAIHNKVDFKELDNPKSRIELEYETQLDTVMPSLKMIRIEHKLNIQDLGIMSGIDPDKIKRIETCQKQIVPPIEILEKLANVLEVSPNDFLEVPDFERFKRVKKIRTSRDDRRFDNDKLLHKMDKKGYTVNELAFRMCRPYNVVDKIVHGHKKPSISQIQVLAFLMGCKTDDLRGK